MSRNHSIELVFFSHPWTLHELTRTGLLMARYDTLLVEAECESMLKMLARRVPGRAPGIVPLLRKPRSLDPTRIAWQLPGVDAPLVLAPIPAVDTGTLLSSLMVLDTAELAQDRVLLLASIANADRLAPVFGMVDRFHILWDLADCPSRELVDCTASLRDHAGLDDTRWGGIWLCNHPLRRSEEHEDNRTRFEEAIREAGV